MKNRLPEARHVLNYGGLEHLISSYSDMGISVTAYDGLESGRKIYNIEYGDGGKKLVSVCGFHGNERSAAQFWCKSLNKVIEDRLANDKKYSIIAPANPDGLDEDIRYNSRGADLNRDWYDFSQVETRIIKGIIDRESRDSLVTMVFDHHECHTEPLYFLEDFTSQWMEKTNGIFLKELRRELERYGPIRQAPYIGKAARCGQLVNYASSEDMFSLIVENMGQGMGERLLGSRMQIHSSVDLAGLYALGKLKKRQ